MVKLNNIDQLSGTTDQIDAHVEDAISKYYRSVDFRREAKDELQEASYLIEEVKDEIYDIKEKLQELGLEDTPAVKDIIARLNATIVEYNRLLEEMGVPGKDQQQI